MNGNTQRGLQRIGCKGGRNPEGVHGGWPYTMREIRVVRYSLREGSISGMRQIEEGGGGLSSGDGMVVVYGTYIHSSGVAGVFVCILRA